MINFNEINFLMAKFLIIINIIIPIIIIIIIIIIIFIIHNYMNNVDYIIKL